MNSSTYRTPMLSAAQFADNIPSEAGSHGRPGTGQHDFVANERQVNGKSNASNPSVVEGVADRVRVVGGVA